MHLELNPNYKKKYQKYFLSLPNIRFDGSTKLFLLVTGNGGNMLTSRFELGKEDGYP